MPDINQSVARQWAKVQEVDEAARKLWDKKDRELKKLIRLAKLGRKACLVVPISETRGVKLSNNFRGEEKVFTPAFARKFEAKEVNL